MCPSLVLSGESLSMETLSQEKWGKWRWVVEHVLCIRCRSCHPFLCHRGEVVAYSLTGVVILSCVTEEKSPSLPLLCWARVWIKHHDKKQWSYLIMQWQLFFKWPIRNTLSRNKYNINITLFIGHFFFFILSLRWLGSDKVHIQCTGQVDDVKWCGQRARAVCLARGWGGLNYIRRLSNRLCNRCSLLW